jgi:hypothetical protein
MDEREDSQQQLQQEQQQPQPDAQQNQTQVGLLNVQVLQQQQQQSGFAFASYKQLADKTIKSKDQVIAAIEGKHAAELAQGFALIARKTDAWLAALMRASDPCAPIEDGQPPQITEQHFRNQVWLEVDEYIQRLQTIARRTTMVELLPNGEQPQLLPDIMVLAKRLEKTFNDERDRAQRQLVRTTRASRAKTTASKRKQANNSNSKPKTSHKSKGNNKRKKPKSSSEDEDEDEDLADDVFGDPDFVADDQSSTALSYKKANKKPKLHDSKPHPQQQSRASTAGEENEINNNARKKGNDAFQEVKKKADEDPDDGKMQDDDQQLGTTNNIIIFCRLPFPSIKICICFLRLS